MDDSRKKAGNYGETAAAGYLEALGYIILAKQFKAAHGEIDIIAKDGVYIVFVEVKYRRQTNFGGARQAVTPAKQRALASAAQSYLVKNGLMEMNCRFDVLEVFGRENLKINHIKDAFWVV